MGKYCNHCMTQLETEDAKCPVCGRENSGHVPAHHLLPGTVLNGKFYVGSALGEGGFGITYIGRDTKLDMKVAIKEFYPNGYVNRNNTASAQVNDSATEGRRDFFEKGRERFLKEAQILARFSGESGVVNVRDFFEENNTAYIIMEYLDGVDLKTYLRQKGTLTPEHTIQLLMPVMNSLKKVHAQGLIHRDISPDNIMIIGDNVKLLDFGAARTVSAAANKSLSVMLKPGYAPEEQYRSKGNQGPWTDIYALCATMYKCITGITPDDATQRVFSDEVKNPSALNVAIKPEIERAIMRGMSVHQTDRYQCIEDLIRGLQGIDVAISGSDQTVAVGKDVENDDADTVYVPNEDDDKTVMGDDVMTSMPTENPSKSVGKPEQNHTQSKPVVNDAAVPAKGKSKVGIIAVAAVALIALIVFLLIPKGGQSNSPSNGMGSTIGTQASENNTTSDPNATEGSKPTDVPGSTESTKPNDDAPIQMSDNLLDYTFELEGIVYKLPCAYDCFIQNGWKYEDHGDLRVGGDSYEVLTMSRYGCEIDVLIYNPSGDVKSVKECKVSGIMCEESDVVSFSIAKGITVRSTIEDVINAFGAPEYRYEFDNNEMLEYYEKDTDNNGVEFSIRKYSTGTGSIAMTNLVRTAEDKITTNTKKPDYIGAYKAPASMGADITSAIIKIHGELYQLPAPVSVFVDNGWIITQQSEDVPAWKSTSVSVEKNGQKLDLQIANCADFQTSVENCMVYTVRVDNDGGASVFVGTQEKSITIGSDDADIPAILPSDYDYDMDDWGPNGEFVCIYSYTKYDPYYYLEIRSDSESNKVTSIEISRSTWED